jgi:chemotaxis protein MotB
MRTSARLLALSCTLAMIGCAPADRQTAEYETGKLEAERDHLQTLVEDERAKVAILQERLARTEASHEIDIAELELARDRVQQLEDDNRELTALLRQRDTTVERPAVAASPLPPEIDQQLVDYAARHSGRVLYDRGRGAVSFANDRLFEAGADAVLPAAQRLLGELAGIAVLLPAGKYETIVVGHTDDTPISAPATLARHPSNWHLSVHRAIAVKNTLVSAGLPGDRLGVMGYGPTRPLAADKARNRRIEVFFARAGEVTPRAPVTPAARQ